MGESAVRPSRGQIWLVDLSPAVGHEQAGKRPALIVSVDLFNHGPADLVVLVPITTKAKGVPLHVELSPQETGLTYLSYAKCEDVRSVSIERLYRPLGVVGIGTMELVEDRLRILLGL